MNLIYIINYHLYQKRDIDFDKLEKEIKNELTKLWNIINNDSKKEYIFFLKKYIKKYKNLNKNERFFNDNYMLIKLTYKLLELNSFKLRIPLIYKENLHFYQLLKKYYKKIEENNIFLKNKLELIEISWF